MAGTELLFLEDDPAIAIGRAALALGETSGVVVFPTDTVYGLLAALDAVEGYQRIFRFKQRSPAQPLQILTSPDTHLAHTALSALARWPDYLAQFTAGRATVVLEPECFSDLPAAISKIQPGTVGLRIPVYAPLQTLLARTPAQAVWATSANVTGQPVISDATELAAALAGWLAGVTCAVAAREQLSTQASAVLQFTAGQCHVLRG